MRRPRLELPGVPMHITHRGVNRAATFIDDQDFSAYRQALQDTSQQHAVSIHAYVLMSNHVHLLVSSSLAGAASRMMQSLGRRYVRAFNARHCRSGTLWEGRFKSCLVDSERYLMTCIRYIELNPVRAAMVERAEDYRWSSVHAHLGLASDQLLTPHAIYLALDVSPEIRVDAYRRWLREGMADDELSAIRSHMQQERALGSPRFQAMVEAALGRPVRLRSSGRPGQSRTDSDSNANVL